MILLFALSLFTSHSNSLPLSTNKRWIVEESGKRMKMHCVNWSSHLNSMLGEGLDLISLKDLIGEIEKLDFNSIVFATHGQHTCSHAIVATKLVKLWTH